MTDAPACSPVADRFDSSGLLVRLRRSSFALICLGLLGVAAPLLLPAPAPSGLLFLVTGVLWGGYVLLALTGWGDAVGRALFPENDLSWGQRAALGLAGAVSAGGVLNLLGLISRTMVLLLLFGGAAIAVANLKLGIARLREGVRGCLGKLGGDRVALSLLGAVVLIAALQLVASVNGAINNVSGYRDFDQHDDAQGYLVFPQKMLQTGSMGPDQFETRRLAAFGGQSFLQTLVLAVLPERGIHLMDAGVALLILLGLTWGLARKRGLQPRVAALLLLFVLAMPHLEARGNVTALLTGTVLVVALVTLAEGEWLDPARPWRNALAVALFIAAACGLKVTFIPAMVLFFWISTLAVLWHGPSRRAALVEAFGTVAAIGVLVLPWMLAMYRTAGTLLYPILGKGYGSHVPLERLSELAGVDLTLPPASVSGLLVKHMLQALPVLILALLARERSPRAPVQALALTLLGTIPLLDHFHDPLLERALYRYYFPILLASLIVGLAACLARDRRRVVVGLRAGAACGVIVAVLLRLDEAAAGQAVQVVRAIGDAFSEPSLQRAAEVEATLRLQAAIPRGTTVLARLPLPSVLDFRRNQIRECSLPGLTSPPPGMPTFAGGERLGAYLADQGVRYLAYGGRDTPYRLLQLSSKDIKDRYLKSRTRWEMYFLSRDFHTSVQQLEVARPTLLSTEHDVVLDLGGHTMNLGKLPQGVTTEGVRADGWTAGHGVISGLGWLLGRRERVLALRLHGWSPLGGNEKRLQPRLLANGRELTVLDHAGKLILFALPPEVVELQKLEVLSTPLSTAALGLGPSDREYGLDLLELATAGAISDLAPYQPAEPPVVTSLQPGDFPKRAGFWKDNNWTNGNAVLSSFRYAVPRDHRFLALTVGVAHPACHDVAHLAVRVFVNGLPLQLDSQTGRTQLFRLYPGLETIERVEITSSTFVPKTLGIGNDTRTLGIPVESLYTTPPVPGPTSLTSLPVAARRP